jgi:inosine-uridine nucleoside N-ribohydrolase
MHRLERAALVAAAACALALPVADAVAQTTSARAPGGARRKVLIDQDGAPSGSDMLSTLALLQAPDVDVLGITVTAGDVWMRAGVQNMLRMLELTGHGQVPVAPGAEFPLINSRDLTDMWEDQFGALSYKGAWNPSGSHDPKETPTPPTGATSLGAIEKHGALLLIETIRKYPNEVTLWVGGPLTTVALALGLDPEVAGLAKELVVMGAGFNVDRGGIHPINGRREFNWWWDPEATRIAMSAAWKKITITPVDISVKTTLSPELWQQIARSNSRAAQFITKSSAGAPAGGGDYMWDEIAALAFLDPSIITSKQELYVNIDIDHGPGYGQTIFLEAEMPAGPGQSTPVPRKLPSWWRVATVQWDLDRPRFYEMFVTLMSR